MRRFLVIVVAVCAGAVSAFADDSMRCDARLVSVGDTEETVARACGPPSAVLPSPPRGGGRRRRPVVVDVWQYDFGRNMFVRTLTFEDRVLKSIDVGDYGAR